MRITCARPEGHMRIIGLVGGAEAIVDDVHYERLASHRWYLHSGGYAVRNLHCGEPGARKYGRNKWAGTMFMHHAVLPLQPSLEVDHINGNKLDNRRQNLRLVSRSINLSNRGRSDQPHGHRGIRQLPSGSWQAAIQFQGKRRDRVVPTYEEAVAVRQEWEKELGI